ncbi:single-stranded DNA-binding protein [Frankia sp. Cpl3]|uniref:single-stranded DNA-binding protein n=1 Tax=Parafrankia colletiae TaxID=573497 RepID=UPI000A05502E|nr:single-stranded DNA-binding protein [Parafrankia colletiae]MCK9904118.1 single-stranded DNA-binding protein [Frankia sp. Cpl3]
MPDNAITLIGNLVENPVLRITASGVSVCGFRLASTPRRFDRTEQRWVDGSTLYLRISCWRQLAENVAASLSRGDRALVVGRLRQNNFETQDGDRRVSYEIDAEAVAAELTWRPVEVRRTARSSTTPADGLAAGDPFADPGPISGDPFSADGIGFGGAGQGDDDPAVAGDVPLADDGRGGGVPDGPVGSDAMPARGPAAPTSGAAPAESSLRSALTSPGASAVTEDMLGADGVGGTRAVELADQGLRLVELGADSGVEVGAGVDVEAVLGDGPGRALVAEAVAVPRLRALFDDALRSVEPLHQSRSEAAQRLSTRAAPGPFHLVPRANRAVGERPIGLADVVGERRLRGLGGATG